MLANQPLLSQGGTRKKEIADPTNRVGGLRCNGVDAVPVVRGHEVIGTSAIDVRDVRAAHESRTYALPANVGGKSGVTRSRRGIITRDFANTKKYGDEGGTSVRG